MKLSFTLAGLLLAAALAGCSTTQSSSTSPGAVGSDSKCCSGETKAACTDKKTDSASPGAVGEGGGCCKSKSAQTSPGAVGEATPGCCHSKTGSGG